MPWFDSVVRSVTTVPAHDVVQAGCSFSIVGHPFYSVLLTFHNVS